MNEHDAKQSLLDLHRQLDEYQTCLPPERARTFITISGDLFASLSAIQAHVGEHVEFVNGDLVAQAGRLSFLTYAQLRDRLDSGVSGDLAHVVLQLGASTSEAIQSFENPLDRPFNDQLLGAMLRMGRAQGALASLQSSWAEAFVTRHDLDVLAAIQAARKAGGGVRGKQLQERASDWKAEALPIAISLDTERKSRNRQQLAMAVLDRLKSPNRPGTVKSVENWLRDEVEPLGQARSRSRKKSAS